MSILEQAKRAKQASFEFKNCPLEIRNNILKDLALIIEENIQNIIENNNLDIEEAKINNMEEHLIDRLTLTEHRILSMIEGIQEIIKLEDPINNILENRILDNQLIINKVTVPFGVIAIIYESRPNVTIDCAALCIKSSNTCILKGGKEAKFSNEFLVKLIHEALIKNNVNKDTVVLVNNPSRTEVAKLMKAKQYIDVLIPRGSAKLINYTVENSTVPVLETGAGICHVYVDENYDENMAINIIVNAKTSRPSVCNSIETLLIHKNIAKDFLPKLNTVLKDKNVKLMGNKPVKEIIDVELIQDNQYDIEHLNLTLSIKIVNDVKDAINHINTFGTKHSESIVTNNKENAQTFFNNVDAAAIYHNASTRFTDGFVFGLGGEIGISTQKMHARGPMGVKELTTYTYHIEGNGQVR
ncbi:MAG: glutamate-5-semialdehyde dehydrogenase [Erysipelotrichaceae bacterium]|nr:glutamate-5-semialdehyde dehydrogenase [Erysipelotrichaceae bacterium]